MLSAKNVNERDFLFPEANFSNLPGPGGLEEAAITVICPRLVSEIPLGVKGLRQVKGAGLRGVSRAVSVTNC